MHERIVLIESNTSGTGPLFVEAAKRIGVTPVLFAEDPSRYAFARQPGLEVVRQSCRSVGEIESRLEGLSWKLDIAGIYTSSEYFIETAGALALGRNLPGADPRAVRNCRNKWTQFNLLNAAGIGIPATRLATTPAEAISAGRELGLPVVLKPCEGTGSVGVRRCDTPNEVTAHAAALLAMRTNERGFPMPPEILVQEYVNWPEFSAEMFSKRLLGITRKHVSEPPYFVETGHDFPLPIGEEDFHRLEQMFARALDAVGLSWGPSHIEFRRHEDRMAIMEINPRLAGGFIPELIRLAYGYDVIEATLRSVLGAPVEWPSRQERYASIRFVLSQGNGTLSAVHLPELSGMADIVDLRLYKNIGDHVAITHDFRDRIGHVIAAGAEPEAIAQSVETARNAVHVEVSPDVTCAPSLVGETTPDKACPTPGKNP